MSHDWDELFNNLEFSDYNTMEGRDYLFYLLHTINWDMQLMAIRSLLRRNKKAAAEVNQYIVESENETRAYKGPHHEHYVDEHTYLLEQSVYSQAAISMSAIGMIAPMLESIFAEAFRELGKMYESNDVKLPTHQRWSRSQGCRDRWNVQICYTSEEPKTDIIGGIPQISDASGLKPHIESDVWRWVAAMLHYRNFMFHGGFEWSSENRQKFQKLIDEQNIASFFESAYTGDDPWTFCLTADTIEQMPAMIEAILDGMAEFAKSLPFELVAKN